MNELPLFNPDILTHIYNNFVHYFRYFNAYLYFIGVTIFLLLNWLVVKYLFKPEYLPVFPDKENGTENRVNLGFAWFALVASFAAYVVRFACEEQTILNNFDSMNPGFMRNLTFGVLPVFKDWRFTPLSHVDGNVIFGVTGNYWMIGWYCVLKQVLCLYLMYKCFSFIPKAKRLYLVALINLIPAVFSVNNIVFPEQNIIIFVLVSLIGLENYQKTGKARHLLVFLLFMNFAIYTKETLILFYAGYGIYWLFEAIFIQKRIRLALLLRPWKQLAVMPAEFLMFVSAFVWVVLYYATTPLLSKNRYLMTHYFEIGELLRIYAVELMIFAVAFFLMLRKIWRRQFASFRLAMEGSILGSAFMVVYVVFWIKIAPSQDYPESYYLYLPAVFCTIYIFENVKNKTAVQILASLIFLGSVYQNYDFFINMQGAARHELVEFIASRAPKKMDVDNSAYPQGASYMQLDQFVGDLRNKPMNIHFFSRQKIDTVFWKTTGWKVSLGLLLPDRNIVLKMDEFYKQFLIGGYAGLKFSYEQAVPGDYIIVNKVFDANLPRLKTLVYENDVYAVYVVD
ncbi:MAG: hypothetical protein J6T72_02160 [Alphaproteobacteria bacterium]|nr:hypothetical protein [Alphaproteobacteria bacterium]